MAAIFDSTGPALRAGRQKWGRLQASQGWAAEHRELAGGERSVTVSFAGVMRNPWLKVAVDTAGFCPYPRLTLTCFLFIYSAVLGLSCDTWGL